MIGYLKTLCHTIATIFIFIKLGEIHMRKPNVAILGAGLVGVDVLAGLLDYDVNITKLVFYNIFELLFCSLF